MRIIASYQAAQAGLHQRTNSDSESVNTDRGLSNSGRSSLSLSWNENFEHHKHVPREI